MTGIASANQLVDSAPFLPESPFAEAQPEPQPARTGIGGGPSWGETWSPFTETGLPEQGEDFELEALAEDVLESLADETFAEALDNLAGEVSDIVDRRIAGEVGTGFADQRLTLARAQLAPVGVAAERYLDHLIEGTEHLDLGTLSEGQLEEVLARHDPGPGGLSPAGEEFIGSLVRKAKSVARVVKSVGSVVAPFLGPVLRRLRGLVQPLLNRVLGIAIHRLPPEFQEPARLLARRLGILRSEAEEAGEAAPPVAVADTEQLAESFDAAMTEYLLAQQTRVEEGETFGHEDRAEPAPETWEGPLAALTEARQDFVDKLATAEPGEDLTPAVERFLPALLTALRIALKVAGRPRVVSAIAGFLAPSISRWVGPALAGPLSRALVDTGLRLATLEQTEPPIAEAEPRGAPLAAQVLAATVEDTVRSLASRDEHVFEDSELLGLALTEAFEEAVAANFPAELVRPEVQLAPTLGGSFVVRTGGSPHAYKRFSRAPEVEVTLPVARVVRIFHGHTLAAALQARGLSLPLRCRVHVFEAMAGTTLPWLARRERIQGLGPYHRHGYRQLHPLTPAVAGILLREPRLGVAVQERYLQSRHRIAVGQRFYYLEPVGAGNRPATVAETAPGATAPFPDEPSCGTARVDMHRSEVVVRLYFSEAQAQTVAAATARASSSRPLLRAVIDAYDDVAGRLERLDDTVCLVGATAADGGRLGSPRRRVPAAVLTPLRRRLDGWIRPLLAQWTRGHASEFVRAAQDPRPGLTITVRLRAVPGLQVLRQAVQARLTPAALQGVRTGELTAGTPTGTVAVEPGRHGR